MLLVVLVIIVLLALGAYTFTEMSVAENEATTMYGRSVLARAFAESGIDVAVNAMADPAQRNRPTLSQSARSFFRRAPEERRCCPRTRALQRDRAGKNTIRRESRLRFGLIDESGKIEPEHDSELCRQREVER